MVQIKTLKLDSTGQDCSICLFRNVQNCPEIKAKLLKGELDATILNAVLIPDVYQVIVAANKAVLADKNGKKLTKTVHTEVLYNCSPTTKITQALKIFGIDDKVKDLLVVTFNDSNGDKMNQMQDLIKGDLAHIDDLRQMGDWPAICKLYGLDSGLGQDFIMDYVVSKTSCKEFLL